MKQRIKQLLKNLLPFSAVKLLRYFLQVFPRTFEKNKTQQIFMAAATEPNYLDDMRLESLQAQYPFLPDYLYDPQSLEIRGRERAKQLLGMPGAESARHFLEFGCWDGMVSCCLAQRGKSATAIDNRDTGFDPRAIQAGVAMRKMDAARMNFEDECFDFVFSYDTFEHVASPDAVLREAFRVLKPGGHLYLEFCPLYYSPFGEHAYSSITVPYCQFLFSREQLNAFALQNGLEPIDFNHVNGWSLLDYRALWTEYSENFRKIRYYEETDLSHLDLIRSYPSCFRSKSQHFDNFIVSGIFALFQKVGAGAPQRA